ncbi:MAG: hypothetical protein IPG96_18305 [Proteobacteria bacterium]|nr:hypothetical protein [Pseudomonadota bacterium]
MDASTLQRLIVTATVTASLLGVLLVSRPAGAIAPGLGSWDVSQSAPAMAGLATLGAVNLGFAIANGVFVAKAERAPTIAVLSYVSGGVGLLAGGLAFATGSSALKATGAIAASAAAFNIAMATWNLGAHHERPRRYVIAPAAVTDPRGRAAAVVSVAGVFP